jgi:hypothetical protein
MELQFFKMNETGLFFRDSVVRLIDKKVMIVLKGANNSGFVLLFDRRKA